MPKLTDKPFRKTVHVRLDEQGVRDLKKKAKKAGLTVSEYVRLVITTNSNGG